MDFERSLLEMIDEYISNALAATGTQQAPRQPRQTTENEIVPLPRTRAPRSTIDLDDEITNVVQRPSKPL